MSTRDCGRKARIKGRKRALAVAGWLRRETGDAYIEAYKCERHHCWHLGHAPGSWDAHLDNMVREALSA